jgi:biopolymer transport protein ExbD
MKKHIILVIFIITTCLAGCSSIKPLSLHHYSRNIVAQKDRTLYVENDQVDFKNLKQELVRRLTTTTTPITVHIHKDLSPSLAQNLINKLKTDGFTDVQLVLFE